jgi:UDP-N-acetyl-D-galactosamine dehydrogenase
MTKKPVVAVIGMGTVGLMIAEAFSKLYEVIGFDIDSSRIQELNRGFDKNFTFSRRSVNSKKLSYTSDPDSLIKASVYIIAVPTILDNKLRPNFTHLMNASKLVAAYLKKNDLIIYESSVPPGATEDYCIPLLEKYSGLKSPEIFGVGFSPERINPGDHIHTELNVHKIVSAQNNKYLKKISRLYQSVLDAKIVPVKSLKVAEACKIIENTIRDVEIATINEIMILLEKLNVNIHEVIKAMSTKWNYLPIKPGLVGGNCIGINTYYLLDHAKKNKIQLPLIKTARKVNAAMPEYIYNQVKASLKKRKIRIKHAKIAIMGLTFKADYYALDNTGSLALIKLLKKSGAKILLNDPLAKHNEVKSYFDLELHPLKNIKNLDVCIFLLDHTKYKKITKKQLAGFIKPDGCIIDLKGIFEDKL